MARSKPVAPTSTAAPPLRRRLLTTEAAAAYLGVTERWMRQSAWDGVIPCTHVGKFLRWLPEDLEAYVQANRTGGQY